MGSRHEPKLASIPNQRSALSAFLARFSHVLGIFAFVLLPTISAVQGRIDAAMADPISMIGLVSGIITFVDFGLKMVSRAKQIRNSGKGTIQELGEPNRIVEDVQGLNGKVKDQISRGQKPCNDEDRILEMVVDCEVSYDQLRILMSKLAVRSSSVFETSRVTIQAILKKNDIHDLQIRLDALDKHIRANIQYLLHESVAISYTQFLHSRRSSLTNNLPLRDQHASIMSRLKEVEALERDLGIKQSSKLDSARDEIMRLTHQTERSSGKNLEAQAAMFTSLVTRLNFLQNEHLATVERVQMLESLYFPEIRRRCNQIPKAKQRTTQWVYDPQRTAFTAWLESTKHDDGLLHFWKGWFEERIRIDVAEAVTSRRVVAGLRS